MNYFLNQKEAEFRELEQLQENENTLKKLSESVFRFREFIQANRTLIDAIYFNKQENLN